jgi:hypothetical protein
VKEKEKKLSEECAVQIFEMEKSKFEDGYEVFMLLPDCPENKRMQNLDMTRTSAADCYHSRSNLKSKQIRIYCQDS